MVLVRPDPTPEPTRPACVSRLRIAGFKPFADPVALDVLPGLTGLVGPNGCGNMLLLPEAQRGVGWQPGTSYV